MKLLRKWWFWAIVAILLVIILSSLGNKDKENLNTEKPDITTKTTTTVTTTKSVETTKETGTVTEPLKTTTSEVTTKAESVVSSYKEGTYKVGTDMDPGEYKVFSGQGPVDSYIEVSKDSVSTPDSILANALFKTFLYVTVSEGQYFKMRDCYAVPVEDAPEYTSDDGTYGDGMYKVGRDIPAGEYKVLMNQEGLLGIGYVEVAKDSTLTIESIVSNEVFENSTYVTVKDGQYLSLRDAMIKTPDL